jgi:hypothetical protein
VIDDEYPSDGALIPDAIIAKDAGVTLRTLATWDDDPQLDFPAAVRIRGRKYRRWGDYQKFKARHSVQAQIGNAGWRVTRTRPRVGGRFSKASGG